MSFAPHVLKMQKDLLEELATSERPVSEVLEDQGISTEVFASWLVRKEFKVQIYRMAKAMRAIRELNIQTGAAKAAESLHRFSSTDADKCSSEKRNACSVVLRLAREQEQRAWANRRMLDPRPLHPQLTPPDMSNEESEALFREMIEEHHQELQRRNEASAKST